MNKEEIQEILEELHLVRPEILQPKAKKLFEAIMSIADERDNLQNNWNELNMWAESCINELKENDVYDRTSYEQGQIIALESFIAKMQELEGRSE